MTSGAKEEVKLGLRNAIKTRRVALGLEGMPHLEAKRPKLEVVSRSSDFIPRKYIFNKLHFQRVFSKRRCNFAVFQNNRYANLSSVIQGHVVSVNNNLF